MASGSPSPPRGLRPAVAREAAGERVHEVGCHVLHEVPVVGGCGTHLHELHGSERRVSSRGAGACEEGREDGLGAGRVQGAQRRTRCGRCDDRRVGKRRRSCCLGPGRRVDGVYRSGGQDSSYPPSSWDCEIWKGAAARRLARLMPGQRSNIWGRGRKDEVAWWDLRVGKENRKTAEANCVLG
jgi:hypothetical protein